MVRLTVDATGDAAGRWIIALPWKCPAVLSSNGLPGFTRPPGSAVSRRVSGLGTACSIRSPESLHRRYSVEACPPSRMAVCGDLDRQDRPRRSPPAAGARRGTCSLALVLAAFPDGAAAPFPPRCVGPVVTSATTGSGDLLPVMPLVRVVGAMVMISGLGIFGLKTAILAMARHADLLQSIDVEAQRRAMEHRT
ncbi:hypothetical protein ACVIJ6_002954 [Bradyrhizobium sp. USDA 4369]